MSSGSNSTGIAKMLCPQFRRSGSFDVKDEQAAHDCAGYDPSISYAFVCEHVTQTEVCETVNWSECVWEASSALTSGELCEPVTGL